MSGEGRREVEATLAVASGSPAEVAEEIAALERVGARRLRWRGEALIRDVYFDTAEGALGERGLALRLRREGGEWTLGLKGAGRPAAAGAVDRPELEAPWSEEGLDRIARRLERTGTGAPDVRPAAGESRPVEALRRTGLGVVQDRRTSRRRAGVLPPEGGAGPAAELALDAVRFPVSSGRRVTHREVEVEAGAGAPAGLPGAVAGDLRERFPGALRPWPHSKLATGLALAEWEPPTGPDGDLLREAYDELERRIEGRGRPGQGPGPGPAQGDDPGEGGRR